MTHPELVRQVLRRDRRIEKLSALLRQSHRKTRKKALCLKNKTGKRDERHAAHEGGERRGKSLGGTLRGVGTCWPREGVYRTAQHTAWDLS